MCIICCYSVCFKMHPIKGLIIILIICMFRDTKIWNGTEYSDCQDFRRIADDISRQIGYDYDTALEKCRKKADKEDRDDVGGEAMSLMVKKAQREAEYQRKKKEKEERVNEVHCTNKI